MDINNFRSLDVDNRAALPRNKFIRINIAATAVFKIVKIAGIQQYAFLLMYLAEHDHDKVLYCTEEELRNLRIPLLQPETACA